MQANINFICTICWRIFCYKNITLIYQIIISVFLIYYHFALVHQSILQHQNKIFMNTNYTTPLGFHEFKKFSSILKKLFRWFSMIWTVCFCCKRCVRLISASLLFMSVNLTGSSSTFWTSNSQQKSFLLEHEYLFSWFLFKCILRFVFVYLFRIRRSVTVALFKSVKMRKLFAQMLILKRPFQPQSSISSCIRFIYSIFLHIIFY